jgi:hypothetical protein
MDLRSLALMRILVGFIILEGLCSRSRFLSLFYTDGGAWPRKAVLAYFANHPPLSIHMATGSVLGEAALLVLAGYFALNLLIGHRTRLFTILSWLMLISLDNRNPFSVSEDRYLLIILLWAIFLPWGKCFSIDSLNKGNSKTVDMHVCSLATAAFLVQIVSFYVSIAIMKQLGSIWNNGHALYLALSVQRIDYPLTHFLLQYPDYLSLMTKFVLYMEMFVPLLILVPSFNYGLRAAALGCLILFHLMIWLTLAVGNLSPISIIALIGIMPPLVWEKYPDITNNVEKLISRAQQHLKLKAFSFEFYPWVTKFARGTSAVMIIFFTLCNLSTAGSNIGLKTGMPNHLHAFLRSMYLDCHWNMFSSLSNYETWYLFEGRLANGSRINILDGRPADYNHPTPVSNFFKEVEVGKFLARANPRYYGPFWGNDICKDWDKDLVQKNLKLKQVRLIETLVPVKRYYQGPEKKRVVFSYACR